MSEKKEFDTSPIIDADVGTAEDVEAIMKKYDRESNTRTWEGVPKQVLRYSMAAFSLFMIWMNIFAQWDERIRRCLFLGVIVLFVFALYPARKGGPVRKNHIPIYDIILALVGSFCYFYYVINLKNIVAMATRIGTFEIIVGIIGILILAECCRRVVGIPILCVAGVFVLYAALPFFAGKPLRTIIYNLFYTTTGIIGTPIGVCSTFIVLFIIFGAFLEATGISGFFIDCANAIAGSATGGPAKVAVISSALCGMVSGSSVGNTVTTGAVTIPLMKKTGYPAEFAGAVEAAASTGGQIMPPIMGAAAFLMAEIVGVPYSDIVVRAILPAFLYFSGIFLMVHFKAKKMGLRGLSKDELPKLKKLLPKIYLLIPLILLIYMITIGGATMARSAVVATIACIVVSFINKDNRMNAKTFVDALEAGTKNTLSVAVACGVAGIIAGVVTMTGLGQVFISAIVGIAGSNLFIALFLTMICCVILGMGVPTTANYIIMATTCAPILTTGMGLNVLAANMFVFYFGIVADITPPVALAAYAGSAIAKAPPMKTAFNATRLAIAAFIVPYIFAFNPAMLFIDIGTGLPAVLTVIQVAITSFGGMFLISAGLMGYMLRDLNPVFRGIAIAAGLMMIIPETLTDILGITVLVVMIVLQMMMNRREKATA